MTAATIKVFDSNYIDLLNPNTTITITDTVADNNGQAIVNFMRNRNSDTAWITTNSTDAANTEVLVDMGDSQTVEDILIINHNLKSYEVFYYDGAAYNSLYTTSSDIGNTTHLTNFGTIETSKIKIIIAGTQVANADKYIGRLIITKEIGTFSGYPQIKSPTHGTNKSKTVLLSGISNIVESTGSFSCTLNFENFYDPSDIALIESIYQARRGLNFWFCGGDESQFLSSIKGYRKKDVYLMRPTDDYSPELYKSLYKGPIKLDMKLTEVVR
jgi:hypothetical protein